MADVILGHGDKVWQEFYCRHCPADDPKSTDPEKRKTGGHFRFKFNLGYDAKVKIVCPKCGHQHDRHVENGVLKDGQGTSRFEDDVVKVPLSAWSRDPFTKKAERAKAKSPNDNMLYDIRGDNVIGSASDLSEAAKAAAREQARPVLLRLHDPEAADGDTPKEEPK